MEHERILRAFGLAGLAIGALAAMFSDFAGDAGRFAAGYGFLTAVSAAYLLIGLAVRHALRRRADAHQIDSVRVPQ
jgi:hypothetical protein